MMPLRTPSHLMLGDLFSTTTKAALNSVLGLVQEYAGTAATVFGGEETQPEQLSK